MRVVDFACEHCGLRCRKPRRIDTLNYFCSTLCSTAWRRLHPVLSHQCAHCGSLFGGHSRRIENRTFCSRKCWIERRAIEKRVFHELSMPARKRMQCAYHKSWYARNRAKKLNQNNEWRKANKPTLARYARERRQKYPEKEMARRYGYQFTGEQWSSLKTRYGNKCLACKKAEPTIRLEPDHVVPLSRGGSGAINNIQPLCRSCNARKHARTIDYRP